MEHELRNTEHLYEARASAVADTIAHRDRPSAFLTEARTAYRQAAAAVAQARASSGSQRVELLHVASAYGEVGNALTRLGSA